MKKLQTLIGSSLILAASTPAFAGSHADSMMHMMKELKPYVGFDGQVRQMRFQKDLGDGHFRNALWQHNYFGGVRVNDYWGLELGYQHTFNNLKNSKVSAGTLFLNDVLDANNDEELLLKHKVRGINLNLKGYWPLWTKGDYQYDVYGLVGASRLTITMDGYELTNAGNPLSATEVNDTYTALKANSWATRLGLGMQVTVKEHYGFRAGVNWEGTSSFTLEEKPVVVNEQTGRPKNSWMGSVGVFYSF